jgi:hypothetical protein
MGFASYDQYINAVTSGQRGSVSFQRVIQTGATSAAGRWHEALSAAGGTGGAMTLTGTAGTGIVTSGATVGGIPVGANVSTATRHLTSMTVYTPSTVAVPGMLLLTDIIHIYPSLVVVTTPSTLSNHPTWTGTGDTRMTNANGVQASMMLTTASSAAGQMTLTYVDQANNTAQAQTGSLFSPVAAHPAGCFFAQTAATATNGGLVMSMGAGDFGVRQVTSYAINAGGTGGTGCIILHRPIAYVPLLAANVPTVFDFTSGPNPFPRIYDDACLGMFVLVGGALTTGQVIAGEIAFAHG